QYGDWQSWGSFLTGDFDGDGKTDIAYRHAFIDPQGIVGVVDLYLANPGKFVGPYGGAIIENTWNTNWQAFRTFLTGDFDGDGRTDIMELSNSSEPAASDGFVTLHVVFANEMVNTVGRAHDWGQTDVTWHQCVGELGATGWTSCGTFLAGDVNGD